MASESRRPRRRLFPRRHLRPRRWSVIPSGATPPDARRKPAPLRQAPPRCDRSDLGTRRDRDRRGTADDDRSRRIRPPAWTSESARRDPAQRRRLPLAPQLRWQRVRRGYGRRQQQVPPAKPEDDDRITCVGTSSLTGGSGVSRSARGFGNEVTDQVVWDARHTDVDILVAIGVVATAFVGSYFVARRHRSTIM